MALLALPNPYLAAADRITALAAEISARRASLGLTAIDQAKQIGISKATLLALTPTSNPTKRTIVRCLSWLATH